MVALLRANKFDAVAKSVSNKISDLLECEPITSLIRHAGSETVKAYIEAEIIKLAANFNGNPALNLKDYQVPVIADMLIENYKWESIEDFTLCFWKASCGMYGEIYRIDGAVIGVWMSRYLDEKYDALEQKKAKEKHHEKAEPRAKDVVDGSKYLNQILENLGVQPQKDNTNAKDNAYQRHKLESHYTPPSEEYIKAHKEKIRKYQEKTLRDKYPGATEEEINQILNKL